MDKILYTYSQVCRRFDIRPETVSDLVRMLKIPSVRHPVNWKAKAIDAEGLRKIEEALTAGAHTSA